MKILERNYAVAICFSIALSSCGGSRGGEVAVDDASIAFSGLKKVMPYFMHESNHGSQMVRFNMSAIMQQGIVIGAEESSSLCESGYKNESPLHSVVSGVQHTLIIDVIYFDCAGGDGMYQDGAIRVKKVSDLSDGSSVSDSSVTEFVNTNYPKFQGSDRYSPLKDMLQAVKVAVTASKQDVLSASTSNDTNDRTRTSTVVSPIIFKTDKGNELIVDRYDTEIETKGDRVIIKKHSVSASWNMVNDASHNQMIRTASFLFWANGLDKTFVPRYYEMHVEVLDELVSLADDPAFPVSGSYQVTLEGQNSITLLTEFNVSGAVVTHSKNGIQSVSRVPR